MALTAGMQPGAHEILSLLGVGAWARYIARMSPNSIARSRLRFCPPSSPAIPSAWGDSNEKRSCWPRSIGAAARGKR